MSLNRTVDFDVDDKVLVDETVVVFDEDVDVDVENLDDEGMSIVVVGGVGGGGANSMLTSVSVKAAANSIDEWSVEIDDVGSDE